MGVQMTKDYKKDKLFFEFNDEIKALQWHSYEVRNLENNTDVIILGSSSSTKYKILLTLFLILKLYKMSEPFRYSQKIH